MAEIEISLLCDKNNSDFVRMLANFEILVDYSIFLIERKYSEGVFSFYNYVFEQYFPKKEVNLTKINYENIFIGEFAKQTIKIYKTLLDLWIGLQDKSIFDYTDLYSLKHVQSEIRKFQKEYL